MRSARAIQDGGLRHGTVAGRVWMTRRLPVIEAYQAINSARVACPRHPTGRARVPLKAADMARTLVVGNPIVAGVLDDEYC
jgi:hypothetical protein